MAIRCILVPLIGLPGVGKTTFCQNIIKFLSEGHAKSETDDELTERVQAVVFHLRYDEFLPRILTTSDDENTTKRYRQAVILVVDCVLQTLANDVECRTVADILAGARLHLAEKEPTLSPETIEACLTVFTKLTSGKEGSFHLSRDSSVIVLIDDNNNYRSMRYAHYRLARKHSVSYLQLYFDAPASVAKFNDALREGIERVGELVIEKMTKTLEEPDPGKYRWERRSCRIVNESWRRESHDDAVDSAETILLTDLSRVIPRILRERHDPVMPFTLEGQVSDEQRSLDRQTSNTSILHQSDVKLRSLVGQRMKLLGEVFDAKSEASKLTQIKSRIYEKLKKGDIQVDLDGIDSELETLFFDEIELYES